LIPSVAEPLGQALERTASSIRFIVRGADPAALPTKADGSVDEEQIPKSDEVGELENIKKGKTKSKTFKLSAGSYILFCNTVDTEEDGTVVSHFARGMHTTINAS
jgi:hypothetical protein